MVEANADAAVVTAKILRETRDAQAAKAQEDAESSPAVAQSSAPAFAIPGVHVDVPQRPPRPPTDPDVAIRHVRLSLAAVIALVLLLVWIRQRLARGQSA